MSHKSKRRNMPANYQLKPSAECEADRQRKEDQAMVRVAAELVLLSLVVLVVLGLSAYIITH